MKIDARIHYLFVTGRKSIVRNQKKIRKAFAGLLTLIALVSALPLFSDHWREIFLRYLRKLVNNLPAFLAYFYDPRAFIIYLILIFLWMTLVYYRYEVRFMELALENKRELALELPKIRQACPNNHYLGLILGKLNDTALTVKDRKGSEIISAIDKNIKKFEKVYWIAEDEIGVIFYEAIGKPYTDFIDYVIRKKLRSEIGDADADLFLLNTQFVMVKIERVEELYTIESKARIALMKSQVVTGGPAIPTPEGMAGGVTVKVEKGI